MKRVGFVFKIKKESINEYKEHHKKVWPEMLEALRKHGWRNYSIFLKPDGTLFGYFDMSVFLVVSACFSCFKLIWLL